MFNFIKKRFTLHELRQPELICFDHLYSDYLSIKSSVNPEEKQFVDELLKKAEHISKIRGIRDQVDEPEIWSELYYFALIIAKYLPVEKLRTKIMRLRMDYQAIAGQRKYDDYLASKPPDLQSPPVHSDPPETKEEYERALRDDLRDLLDRIYLEYSILPVRETRLTDLTWLAAKLCLFSLCILLVILSVLFLIPLAKEMYDAYHGDPGGWLAMLNVFRNSANLSSLTVFVVVVVGAMGGFVSALQRIQSPPTEGDSLYNLSLLFHGSKSVFVAPISGSIFAIVLYLMFASGILSGTFFPTIYTPEGKYTKVSAVSGDGKPGNGGSTPTPTPKPSPTTTPATASNTAASNRIANTASNTAPTAAPSESPTATPRPSVTPSPTPSPSPSVMAAPSPTPIPVPEQGMNVFDFLARSGPARGTDYALLIIWCFIAGFAERFVPDALDRLISNENSGKRK